jgi:hypothetical protein
MNTTDKIGIIMIIYMSLAVSIGVFYTLLDESDAIKFIWKRIRKPLCWVLWTAFATTLSIQIGLPGIWSFFHGAFIGGTMATILQLSE